MLTKVIKMLSIKSQDNYWKKSILSQILPGERCMQKMARLLVDHFLYKEYSDVTSPNQMPGHLQTRLKRPLHIPHAEAVAAHEHFKRGVAHYIGLRVAFLGQAVPPAVYLKLLDALGRNPVGELVQQLLTGLVQVAFQIVATESGRGVDRHGGLLGGNAFLLVVSYPRNIPFLKTQYAGRRYAAGPVEHHHHRQAGLVGNGAESGQFGGGQFYVAIAQQGVGLRGRYGQDQLIGFEVVAGVGAYPAAGVGALNQDYPFAGFDGEAIGEVLGYGAHTPRANVAGVVKIGFLQVPLFHYPHGLQLLHILPEIGRSDRKILRAVVGPGAQQAAGGHAPAHAPALVEHGYVPLVIHQLAGGGEPGHTGPDNNTRSHK